MGVMERITFEELKTLRWENPGAIADSLASRKRRSAIRGDGKLFIIAADHPARGSLSVGSDDQAMASRRELLERMSEALSNPNVDGVLGTPDVIDDLALMGLLEDKIVVGSMNRGGLRGSSFEFDDRFTAYTVEALKRQGLDFGKTLLRINLDDKYSVRTLEFTAQVIEDALRYQIPILLEPFMSNWVGGTAKNDLSVEAVIKSVAIASGLGSSSSLSWLKLPVVPEMHRVMEATTLPTLLLGGEVDEDQDATFTSWESALKLPGVRGLVVGRSLLYPTDGDVSAAVAIAAGMVHEAS